jgi:hypothetical protein
MVLHIFFTFPQVVHEEGNTQEALLDFVIPTEVNGSTEDQPSHSNRSTQPLILTETSVAGNKTGNI